MGQQIPGQAGGVAASGRLLPWLVLLFAGSGCSALIYEIVWFQLLELVIGSSAVSLGTLLGTFMGGMCLGSLALPYVISPRRHPFRIYALIEVGIGISGLLVLFGMPAIAQFYMTHGTPGLAGIFLRGAICALCLLPPTVLMGATLPAIARWIKATPEGISWLGFFYSGNIAGAVLGCLLAGFYLLRVYDMKTATFTAAAVNGVVAMLALVMAALAPHEEGSRESGVGSRAQASGEEPEQAGKSPDACALLPTPDSLLPSPQRGIWAVYLTAALSGFCALGAEVVWTRLLSLLIGGTVYTFSIILAVFLLGLGLGSQVGALLTRAAVRPRILLGVCQLLLTAAVAWAAFILTRSLPYWPISSDLSISPWLDFQLDFLRCLWAVLPGAFLWGASFPLALGAAAGPQQDPGRLVGKVYAANTVGAILGGIGSSLFLIRWLGTQQTQRLLIGLSALAALLMLASFFRLSRAETPEGRWKRLGAWITKGVSLMAALGVVVFLAWGVAEVPGGLVAFGRELLLNYQDLKEGRTKFLYVGEGMNSSVAVSETHKGNTEYRVFHVSGKAEASSVPQDMRLQRMLGHIPGLLHPKPRSVLVVGCGAGVTAGSFVLYPAVQRIVICEIEPLIPQAVTPYFSKENNHILEDPRVEVVYDDARNYILTTQDKYDIITSDPIHPWVRGAATLYTKEYFELCKKHLNPGGLVTQWVPLYQSDLATVKSEIATFFQVFPHGTIWSNDDYGEGYDIVLLGQAEPARIDVDDLQQRLQDPAYSSVAHSLKEVGFSSAVDLLAKFTAQGQDLGPWLANAAINRDENLRLQYLAGMGLKKEEPQRIHDEMTAFRKFPEGLFVASAQSRKALQQAWEGAKELRDMEGP